MRHFCKVSRREFEADVFARRVRGFLSLRSRRHIADNPVATREDIEEARANLRALLGTVTLRQRDGILWAHPAPNAKGFTEVKPLDGLSINSPKVVAGAGFEPATFGL